MFHKIAKKNTLIKFLIYESKNFIKYFCNDIKKCIKSNFILIYKNISISNDY